MERSKSVITDMRAPPPPPAQPEILADEQSYSVSTAVTGGSSSNVSKTAISHQCEISLANLSGNEYNSHVENCTVGSKAVIPANDTQSSSLTSPPRSNDRSGELPANYVPPGEDLDGAQKSQTDAAQQVESEKSQTDAGHQVEEDSSDSEDEGSITAYARGEQVYYESEVEEDDEETFIVHGAVSQLTSVNPSIRSSPVPISEIEDAQVAPTANGTQSVQPSVSSSKPTSSQPPAEDDQPQPSQSSEMPQVSITETIINSRATNSLNGILKHPMAHACAQPESVPEVVPTTEPTAQSARTDSISQSSRIGAVPQSPSEFVLKITRSDSIDSSTRSGSIPKSTYSDSVSTSPRAASIPRSVPPGAVPESGHPGSVPEFTLTRPQKKKAPKKVPFQKLTPVETFEAYLAKPEEMSYDQLYHKTAVVAKALVAMQEEYDRLDKKTADYDAAKKYEAKLAAEAKKVIDDKETAEHDLVLLDLHARFKEELKKPLKEYNLWLEQEQAAADPNDPETNRPYYWLDVKQIKNPEVMSKVHKRQRLLEKQQEAKPTTPLVDAPLPALRKGDEEVRKKRDVLLDPVVFEDRKTADVYMAEYSKHKDAIGNQVLKNRNAAVVVEEKDENGRPKRSRGKRAYDTEQTNTPGGSDSEEAALGKRRRTARVVQDLPTSPARRKTATREASPKVSVFPKSGKRIGRPPKSKGDILPPIPKSSSKSKLQQSHLPPPSNPADSSDSDDEIADPQSPRELEPVEEAELQEAAESLVSQTQAASTVPTKPKHAGGRPRKNPILNAQSEGGTPEVKASPKKGGRAAKPKAARGGRAKNGGSARVEPVQLIEENDVIQSTEKDDESRFASASTSRPTTSSSAMTTSTGRASRAASRAATFEASQAATVGDVAGSFASETTKKGRGGKRKRAGVENGDQEVIQATASVPKKRRTGLKKQDTIVEVDENELVTPEATGEAVTESSTTASGRPKRKMASALPEFGYAALAGEVEEFDPDDESEPQPQKRRKGVKATRTARKGKEVKQEAIPTESEYTSEAAEETIPEPKKHQWVKLTYKKPEMSRSEMSHHNTDISDFAGPVAKQTRAPKRKPKEIQIRQYSYEDATGNSSAATGTTPRDSEFPSAVQTGDETDGLGTNSRPVSRKGKGKEESYTPNLESGAEMSGHDGDGEEGGFTAAQEEARKKAQKSRKLAEATRERWAKGLMKGPMEKRAATNAAKKAAKDAAKGGIPDGMPPSSFTPAPFFSELPPVANPGLSLSFLSSFATAPPMAQNPFSAPPGGASDMYAHLEPYSYVGGPPLPATYGHSMPFMPPPTFACPASFAPPPATFAQQTTFLPVTVAPSGKASSPRKAKAAPAKKRRAPAKNAAQASTLTSAPSSNPQPATQAPGMSVSASASTLMAPAPGATRGSTRVRKPTRRNQGLDGAADDEEEDDDVDEVQSVYAPGHFKSEYERYQALTSPRSPLTLGKRKRKSLMDLSAMRDDEEEEEDDELY
ncbi:uncharacterized protein RAG0_12286 [Rhynchosporium agropyri]|uniref:Uncharacterized protein n=1 Tax=Rhynchosporium agropyri TaxID=914238 RepID=A0A1E1L7T7_9HELO|nr:uncharacterized protein RAG0_12286 [Rhynchosporium agropyri]